MHADLQAKSSYPQPGCIGSVIEHTWMDAVRRNLVRVNTKR